MSVQEIDPRFFNQPYFLAPGKGGDRAYTLLRTALEKTGLAAIAKVVIRPPREHLALIKPLDQLLMVETLHFADELRSPAELEVHQADVGEKELSMAVSLVKTMEDEWAPETYRDEYRESLMKVIEQKVKTGGKTVPAAKGGKAGPQKIIDLVSLLQESIGEKQQKPKRTKASSAQHKGQRKAA